LELQYEPQAATGGNGNGHSALAENSLTLREVETRYIEAVLADEEGSIERAARRLGISRSTLYSKVKHREVERPGGEVKVAPTTC
jgi:DNA-binding NtrC family response regulator